MYYMSPVRGYFYRVIAGLRQPYRYVLLFLLVGMLIYGWFYWVYSPINRIIEHHTTALCENKKKCSKNNQSRSDAHALRTSADHIVSRLNAYLKNTYSTKANYTLFFVLDKAKLADLRFISYFNETIREESLAQVFRTCWIFEGSLPNAILFLHSIVTRDYLIGCSHIECSCIQDGHYTISMKLDSYHIKIFL